MDGSKLIAEIAGLSILSLESQHNRLLRLDFPRHDAPARATLLVNSIKATEELSRDFEFRVDLISDSANIDPASMMAKMATISMVRSDGSLRYFNGYITEFQLIRADGGLAYYQMLLEPWLAFTRLTEDCYSFHNRSVIELTEDTFADYVERDWKTRITGELPTLTCANQYNESDHNHLHRRWEAAGLFYWYEHRSDGHTLWLSDDSRMAESIDEVGDRPGEIRFHAAGGSSEDDSIREWRTIRRIKPGRTTLVSFDYKNPASQVATGTSVNRQGDVFAREVYQNMGYGFDSSSRGDELAARKMQAVDADALQFAGIGSNRNALPGRTFRLTDHFSSDPAGWDRNMNAADHAALSEFLVIRVSHSASNNYQNGSSTGSHYDNELTCIRAAGQWLPQIGHNSIPHPIPGILTATVVGPEGEEISTDEMGRVKVQFHWDRVGELDLNSSAWIRIKAPLSGAQFGHVSLPRIGDEVVIEFLNGNIDHPLITGGVYNSNNMPPWNLPGAHTLMGLRSRELSSGNGSGSSRSNHLVLDDTPGRIQAQLKSDHQCSQISLGHIARIDDAAGRKEARGEGWEIATDAWGVARAGRGMLITTESRPNASQHAKSIDETAERFGKAHDLHKCLADSAVEGGAQEAGQQTEVANSIKTQNDAIKGVGGDGPFPELVGPHLVLSSPAGIEMSSAQSTHIASAKHTALTAEGDVSIATGDSLFATVRKTFRLFVHKAGMKLIAAGGKVTIQSQSDDVELMAKKVISLMSESDWIELRAKKGVRLHGANHMLEVGEKVQFFTSSPVLFHGNLETLPTKSASQAFNERPTSRYDQEVLFVHPDGKAAKDVAYELIREDGNKSSSKTNASGSTELQRGSCMDRYTVRYKGDLP